MNIALDAISLHVLYCGINRKGVAVMSKNITLRLPDDIHAEVVEAAEGEYRSLNQMIIVLLREALAVRRRLRRQGGEPAEDEEIDSPALAAA